VLAGIILHDAWLKRWGHRAGREKQAEGECRDEQERPETALGRAGGPRLGLTATPLS
jgi:hypothetical protein